MTKEDIKQICQIYDNFRSERDAAIIAYNSDDTFWEHILATYNLSQPSLPSNLDEAAEKWKEEHFRREYYQIPKDAMSRSFKAGAEWMAGQFLKIEGELVDWYSTSDGKDYCCGVKTIDAFEVPEGFYTRKKQ